MPSQPFFTVGVPTHNRAALLADTLRTLLAQTFDDFEILVCDNASSDDTPSVVKRFSDPRIRYVRHDPDIGANNNFIYIGRHFAGRYLVYHQDDDLLHHEFLERCHAAVTATPGVTLFGAPLWLGKPGGAFESSVMPAIGELTMESLVSGRVPVLDGAPVAVSMLHSTVTFMPAIAMCGEALRAVGGYYDSDGFANNDAVTTCRVMLRGKVAFDPSPGGVHRYHESNYYHAVLDHDDRARARNIMYRQFIEDFGAAGVDWRAILDEQLRRLPPRDLQKIARKWLRYGAPAPLAHAGVEAMAHGSGRSGLSLEMWLLRRLGAGNLWRYHTT